MQIDAKKAKGKARPQPKGLHPKSYAMSQSGLRFGAFFVCLSSWVCIFRVHSASHSVNSISFIYCYYCYYYCYYYYNDEYYYHYYFHY